MTITRLAIRGVLAGLAMFFALGLASSGQVHEITGTVVEVSGTSVRIAIDSELLPNVGDRVEIFAAVPGVGDAPLAGSWVVTEVGEESVEAVAVGEAPRPQAGQNAIITSENPRSRAQLTADSMLMDGVDTRDLRQVEQALQAGADPDLRMEGGYTVLINAAGDDSIDIVQALIQAGADLNATEPEYGATALMLAAGEAHLEIMRVLIRAGADVNLQAAGNDDGEGAEFTALMAAAMNGYEGVVSELLAAGADRSIADRAGVTALDLAESGGHEEVVRLLRSAR